MMAVMLVVTNALLASKALSSDNKTNAAKMAGEIYKSACDVLHYSQMCYTRPVPVLLSHCIVQST